MIEAFISESGSSIYPFAHIARVTIIQYKILRIELLSGKSYDALFDTIEDRFNQLHNFKQYLTKPEPTTTELS